HRHLARLIESRKGEVLEFLEYGLGRARRVHDSEALGVERDLHQSRRAVEATEHPVVRAPGTLVERSEMGELETGNLALRTLRTTKRAPAVGAELRQLDDLFLLVVLVAGGARDHFELEKPSEDRVIHVVV